MPDLRSLLNAAAEPVRSGPDLAAITGRAGALRRRALAVRAGGAALAVAALVPLALLDGGGTDGLRQAELQVDPEATTAPAPLTSPAPPAASGRVLGPPVSGAAAPPASASAAGPVRAPAPPASPRGPAPEERTSRPEPTPAARGEEHPPAASCRLTTRDMQTDAQRTCRFTSTADGGWRLTRGAGLFYGYEPGTYRVLVEREGAIVYDTDDTDTYDTDGTCADDVIRAGDRVTLMLESNPNNYADVELAAGEGYGC